MDNKKYFSHETAIIDDGCLIGQNTKIWHFSHLMSNCVVDENCNIGQNVVISPEVTLGKNVKVQNNVSIYEGVEIEDDVFLGPSMVFTNVTNPRSFIIRKDEFKKTLLKKGCSVGANATIVCGLTIGEYSLIGAGSVVTRNIKPFELVFGNPARHRGWVSVAGNRLIFNDNNIAEDSFDNSKYKLSNHKVQLIS